MKKRVLSILLAIMTVVGLVPRFAVTASAADRYEYPDTTPVLTWTGSGTSKDPYVIDTAQELADFAWLVNNNKTAYMSANYKLGGNIDLSGGTWMPIGYNRGQTSFFGGTFDGGGFIVSGLNDITPAGTNYAALFGGIKTGTVKNLTVSGIFTTTVSYAAGICAYAISSTFENCVNQVNITCTGSMSSYVGGIIGYGSIDLDIKNCTNSGTISNTGTGKGSIGGISGMAAKGSVVSGCNNTGNITGKSESNQGTGGIVGYVNASGSATNPVTKIENCTNSGVINGTNILGGIAGKVENSECNVINCSNSSAVTGTGYYVGGICGHRANAITGCYNTANITGSYHVGGISGGIGNNSSAITKCYNSGTIKGTYKSTDVYVGGIEGKTQGKSGNTGNLIENCYNTGTVSGYNNSSAYVGGICGWWGRGQVANCHSYGNISNGDVSKSGAIGSGSPLTNCYYLNGTDDNATKKNTNEFANGTVCRLLQSGNTAPVWGQTIGTDNYPVFNNGNNTLSSAVTGITVTPESITIPLNGTTTLTATVFPDDVDDKTVTWGSSDSSIATVDDNGVVTGAANGIAIITAATYDGSYIAACTVTVCGHKESLHTDYTYNAGTHTYTCSECKMSVTEDCGIDHATGKCTVCSHYAAVVSVTADENTTHYKDIPSAIAYITILSESNPVKMQLTADSAYDNAITFPEKPIELDLNGKTASVNTVDYASGADVTIQDSTDDGAGKLNITTDHTVSVGAKLTLESGFVGGDLAYNHINGTFIMNGGTIEADYAVSVNSAVANVTITGGTIKGEQYGLYRTSAYPTAAVTLSGGYFIKGINNAAPISDILAEGCKAVDNNNNETDTTEKSIQTNVTVIPPHKHEWFYAASGNTITAACTADGCSFENGNGGSVTLTAPDSLTYNGSPIEAVVTNTLETGNTISVVYIGENLTEGKPLNAGTYTASITLDNKTAVLEYIIDKADAIVPNGLTAVYGQTLADVSLPEGWTWTDSTTPVGSSGNQNHTANYAGTINYNAAANVTLIVTVARSEAEITAKADKSEYTYGESAIITVSGIIPTKQAEVLTFSLPAPAENQAAIWNGGTQLTEPQTVGDQPLIFELTGLNAGSYTLTVQFTGSDNLAAADTAVSFMINKADQKDFAIADKPAAVAYGDSFSLKTSGGSGSGAVTWQILSGSEFAELSEKDGTAALTIKGVGTVVVTAFKASDENYNEISDTYTIQVDKAVPDVTAPSGLTADYGDTLGNVTLPEGWAWRDPKTTTVGDAGENTFTAVYTHPTLADQYTQIEVPVIITVIPKILTASVIVEDDNFIFNGSEHQPGVVVWDGESIVPESEYTVLYSDNINAGTASVTVTDKDGGNYTVSGSAAFSIAKKASTPLPDVKREFLRTIASAGNTVNVAAMLPANCGDVIYTVTSSDYTVLENVTVDENGKLLFDTAVSDTTLTDTITLEVKMQNYTTATLTVNVMLNDKTPQKITGVSPASDLIYNGKAQQGYTGTPVSEYTGDYEVTYTGRGNDYNSTTAPAHAGDYTVTIRIPENDLYYSGSISLNFTIGKAKAIVTADDKEAYAGDRMPTLTYKVGGLIGDDTLRVSLRCHADMYRVGETPIVVTADDPSGCYEIITVNGKLTVNQFVLLPVITPHYPPVLNGGENGDITVAPKNPGKGTTVLITPTPHQGYEVAEVLVTDSNGNPVTVIDNGDGTYRFKQPVGSVTITASFQKEPSAAPDPCDGTEADHCPSLAFTDLLTTEWYHHNVDYVLNKGVMNGTGDGTFAPNGTLSRAMLVTILWRLEDKPVVDYLMTFEDVAQDSWYGEAVRWAASAKIVNGYSDTAFGPDDDITREQLAAILYRYEQRKGGGFKGLRMFRMDYADLAEVSDWAYEAICRMTMNGVITGNPDKRLHPKETATRAEAAAMLNRYCDLSKEK